MGCDRLSGGTSWPRVRELRGFARLDIAPGGEVEAVFAIDHDTLASVDRDLCRTVEPGEIEVGTGPASDRTQGARLEITAPVGQSG
ncbi:fibronectin type III-like domain-contianing protein [Streptomyces sp. NPDC050523]|uniref:fibronectin type III-like domain-contianing protein n=1 Tax=Streptomyces sp. NPDC050523 TaxID=3365622 RepID=UPI0037895CAB